MGDNSKILIFLEFPSLIEMLRKKYITIKASPFWDRGIALDLKIGVWQIIINNKTKYYKIKQIMINNI